MRDGEIPAWFSEDQSYLNQFKPTTVVSFQLSVASNVKLVVYDLLVARWCAGK